MCGAIKSCFTKLKSTQMTWISRIFTDLFVTANVICVNLFDPCHPRAIILFS